MKKIQYLNKKESYLFFLIFYIPINIILVFSLIIFVPYIFDKSYFQYQDFQSNYEECDLYSPNILFNQLCCWANIKNISSILPIVKALLINTFKDFGFFLISTKMFTKRASMIFLLLLAIHPYMALYHVKFSTEAFACLGVYLLFYRLTHKIKYPFIWDFIFILLTGMRNALLLLYSFYFLSKLYLRLKLVFSNKFKIDYKIFYLIIIIILLICITQNDILISNKYLSILMTKEEYIKYLEAQYYNYIRRDYNIINFFLSINEYKLNLNYFLNFIDSSILFLDYIIAILMIIFSHIILLLGFREAAFTTFPDYFLQTDLITIISIFIGIFFIFFHGLGLFNFFKFFLKINFIYFAFITLILIHFFTIAHLRYLLPIMPLSLIGLVMLYEKIKFNDNFNSK